MQLTKLVKNLARDKKHKQGLEAILDRSDVSGDVSSSSSGSRSKAAAYQRLKAALTDRPEWIYRSIEDKLEEDFTHLRSAPNASGLAASSRGWVEHRSKLGHYPATIRMAWIIAGVHDALRAGDPEQARARCALALAAINQSALDQGSWTLAQEYLLELPPPYGSFVNRRLPDASEQVTTRLADERLAEVLMWRVKDRDSFAESKKRLNSKPLQPKAPPTSNPGAKAAPKWMAKPKAKTKAALIPGEEQGGAEA